MSRRLAFGLMGIGALILGSWAIIVLSRSEEVKSLNLARSPERSIKTGTVEIASKPNLVIQKNLIRLDPPVPKRSYRVGEQLVLKGTLDVPSGYQLFEKDMFLEIQGRLQGRTASLLSRKFPLQSVGPNLYRFDIVVSDPNELPSKPGRYHVRLTALGFESEAEAASLATVRGRSVAEALPFLDVPFEVTNEKK